MRLGTSPMGDGLDFIDWCVAGDAFRGWNRIARFEDWPEDERMEIWDRYGYLDRQQVWNMGGRMFDRRQAEKAKEPQQMELAL